jgi:hypothetical protein
VKTRSPPPPPADIIDEPPPPPRDRTRADCAAPLVIVRTAKGHFSPADRAAILPVILNGLAEGVPLAVICRAPGMPAPEAVGVWRREDDSIASDYAHARDAGWDLIAHKLRATARGSGDSSGDVQRDKLIVDTDLRLLRSWAPARYGENLPASSVNVAIGVQVGQVTEDQRARAMARKAAAVARRKARA